MKAEREAAKAEKEARQKVETNEKRSANLARLAEASTKSKEYRERVKGLTEQTRKDLQLSREYERELEELAEQSEGSRKRAPSSSASPQISKKPSTIPENGGV